MDITESALINADEELLHTAGIATFEADKSQQEVERWRLEVSAQMQRLKNIKHEKELLLKEMKQLEQDLERTKINFTFTTTTTTNTTTTSNNNITLEKFNSRNLSNNLYNINEDKSVIMPGTFMISSKGIGTSKEVELQYLISRTIASLDNVQTDVNNLKKQHADLWYRYGEVKEDIKRLKTTYLKQEEQKEELLHKKLFIKAAEADPTYRKGLKTQEEMIELIRHTTDRKAAIRQTRVERTSLVAHLLDGAVLREKQARYVNELITQKKNFNNHPMYSMLLSLQKENISLREKYLHLVRSSEEEDVALVEYLDILGERLLLTSGES